VIGVDFSGARDAGRRIWIAEGRVDDRRVHLDSCFPAAELPESGRDREAAHLALVAYLGRQDDAVAGLDLPFSLPRSLMQNRAWIDFVRGFPRRYASPEDFRAEMVAVGGGRELKRRTDIETRVPFAAINMRMYRQTHYGIGAVLAPLIAADAVRAIPLQPPADGKAILAEICPASLLKSIDLYPSYKGTTKDHRRARRAILTGLVEGGLVARLPPAIEITAVNDPGGDALDAMLAAVCAAHAARANPQPIDEIEAIEGRVYF